MSLQQDRKDKEHSQVAAKSAEDSRGMILSLIFLPPGSGSESSSPALGLSPAACLRCVDCKQRKQCVISI